MNVGEIRSELTKMLGNTLESTGHPFVTPVDLRYRWITRAANKIPRYAAAGGRDIASTFGELTATWKAQTANGIAYLDRPTGALIIRELYSFNKTGANVDLDAERLVTQLRPEEFGRARTATEAAGWPRSWTMIGERLKIRPLPVTAYLTDVHLYGIKREVPFNSDAQTPMLREDWHEAILFEAAAIGAEELGYFERADRYRKQVAMLVQTGVEVPVQEDLFENDTFDLTSPDYWSVLS